MHTYIHTYIHECTYVCTYVIVRKYVACEVLQSHYDYVCCVGAPDCACVFEFAYAFVCMCILEHNCNKMELTLKGYKYCIARP